jgi:hypothetical protein
VKPHLKENKTGCVSQAVDHLLCKHEALHSNPQSYQKSDVKCLLLI